MRGIQFYLLVLLFTLSTSGTSLLAGGAERGIWGEFIDSPNREHYSECLKEIHDSLSGDYGKNSEGEQINTPTQQSLISNYKLFSRFNALVREANYFALDLAFAMRFLTDGAAAEDLYAAIGMTVKKRPKVFLAALDKHKVENLYQIKQLVTALPIDEFVDDTPKRILEIKARIEALETITDRNLKWYKDKCIAALNKQLRFYESKSE